ncbi:MAG: L,D-transpeptidase [Actinomycetota bacterium]|nr:L,D-transpeptidase [Actinomycetota bacterium]
MTRKQKDKTVVWQIAPAGCLKARLRHRETAFCLGGGALKVVIFTLFLLLLSLSSFSALAPASSNGARDLVVGSPDSSLGGVFRLSWKIDNPLKVAAYRVYRSEGKASRLMLVHEEEVNMEWGNTMDYFDTGLEDGVTYFYQVAVVGKDGREIGRTNIAKAKLSKAPKSGGLPGKRIIISVYDQRIYFLENEQFVKSHLCSTGVDSHPTPMGVFKVLYHSQCVISEKYGGLYCYWWMGFAPDTGMHALPYNPKTKKYTGGDKLGRKASHGCVRQAVADAEWAYRWVPDGTRIDIIGYHYDPPPVTPPPPPIPPITGGHTSPGMSEAQNEWYFAEGCTSGGFDTYILMSNPTDVGASVKAEYMKPDGSTVIGNYIVPAFSRFTIHANSVAGLESAEFSTRLTSDRPIAADRSMYFDYQGKLGGTSSSGVSAPSKTWYFAEGFTGGSFDEFILVQNPGEEAGTLQAKYMPPDGETLSIDYPIGPHSRLSVHVDDIPELANSEVSVMLNCDVEVVAERAQYFDYYGRAGGEASAGAMNPSKEWYLAEGYTGFDEYVLIQNPGEESGEAKVTFMCPDGRNVNKTYQLEPHSRFTIRLGLISELGVTDVSTLVESDVDVVVERSQYFDYFGRQGGADGMGVSKLSNYWYFAEGYTGGGYDTYILAMNPGDEGTNINVNFLLPGGGIIPFTYPVGPKSRYTIHVDAIPTLANNEFSTTVSCDKPIVCERAMYFSIPRQ